MVDDLTHGHAAENETKKATLPSVAVGAINESQTHVTGEVSPFPKQGCLRSQQRRDGSVVGLPRVQ